MAAQWYWPPAVGALFSRSVAARAWDQEGGKSVHRDQFGQHDKNGEGTYPAEDVGIDGTAGATTGKICQ